MAYDKALVQKAATDNGVPQDLLERLIAEESSGDPKAVSYRGPSYGEGLTQLSEGTAHDEGVTDRLDAGQSIEGGAKYLAGLHREFGSWPLALAAYVSGPETVRKAGGIPDNPQVKRYVEKVTGQMSEAAAPAPGGSMNKAVETLVGDEQAGLAAYDKASEKASGVNAELAQREAAIGKQIEGIDGELDRLSAHRPTPPAEGKLPDYKPPAQKNPLQALTTVMPLMLLAGSRMGRNKGLALMKSASGLLGGVNAGNDEARKHYQEDFKAKLGEAIEQQKMDHDHYMDIMDSLNTSGKDALAKLQVFAALSENDQLRAAALNGDFKAVADRMQMSGHVLTSLLEVQRNALSSEQNAINNRLRQQEIDASAAKTPPATRAYNDAFAAAKKAGKTDEEAQSAATGALKNAEYAMHPTAAAAQGRAEEKVLAADPRVKTFRTTSQFFGELDSVTPADLDTANGQIRILDAFTKLATGGQAIRQFMATSATKYLGWMNEAQALAQRATTTKGAVMSHAAAEQYLDGAKKIRGELEKNYDATLAEHARTMDQRGVDPATGGIPEDDLERIMQKGLYTPSKGVTQAAPKPADGPPVGTVEGGHRFKGGDPSKPENWEPVQ